MLNFKLPVEPPYKRSLLRVALLAAALGLSPSLSQAYVECTLTPARVFVDSSSLWIVFSNGGAGVALASDVAMKYYYASALAAFTSGKSLVVRYGDGTPCEASNVGIIGLWIQ